VRVHQAVQSDPAAVPGVHVLLPGRQPGTVHPVPEDDRRGGVVGDPHDAPEASLRGRVVQTSFLGSQTRIAVSCDAVDAPITAAEFGRDRSIARQLTPEREVALWWDKDDAVILPDESMTDEEE